MQKEKGFKPEPAEVFRRVTLLAPDCKTYTDESGQKIEIEEWNLTNALTMLVNDVACLANVYHEGGVADESDVANYEAYTVLYRAANRMCDNLVTLGKLVAVAVGEIGIIVEKGFFDGSNQHGGILEAVLREPVEQRIMRVIDADKR